jgi:hypothetical protein
MNPIRKSFVMSALLFGVAHTAIAGQHTWDVAFRVDRRLAKTRGGATLDAFAQAFHPVGSKARSIDETPIACSSALFFGVAIGF